MVLSGDGLAELDLLLTWPANANAVVLDEALQQLDTLLQHTVPSIISWQNLRKRLEDVAADEGRSVAQICEAFLIAGLTVYQQEGTRYVRRLVSRQEE